MSSLTGKVAFITGAGNGIGRATAILFAGQGAKVAIAEIDTRAGEETAHLAGNEAIAIRADVTDADSLQARSARPSTSSAVSMYSITTLAAQPRVTTRRSTRRSMNSGGRLSSTFTAHFSGAGSASPN
jgi:NAD(P)-dependent dehydrogenase (short-subunit alcohol dehydrogenase family)